MSRQEVPPLDRLAGTTLTGKSSSLYRLEGEPKRGGHSFIYQATREHDGATVAVKFRNPEAKISGSSFDRETDILLNPKYRHKNLVTALDQGRHGDVPFLVLEWVPNTLQSLVPDLGGPPQRACLTWEQFYPLLKQVLQVLVHLHGFKIVHRDVKPSNLLLDNTGQVIKLADLGIAYWPSDGVITSDQAPLGTRDYQPPWTERTPDASFDLYPLGLICCDVMLAGRPDIKEPDRVAFLQTNYLRRHQKELPEQKAKLLNLFFSRTSVADRLLGWLEGDERREKLSLPAAGLQESPIAPADTEDERFWGGKNRQAATPQVRKPVRGDRLRRWRSAGLLLLGVLALAGVIWWFRPSTTPWPVGEPLVLHLSGGWEVLLTRDEHSEVVAGDRIGGKLRTAVLRHPEFGEFESQGPSAVLTVSQPSRRARGSIEGEFLSRKLHQSLSFKVPSGSVWMKGKIHCTEDALYLEPSHFKLQMKRHELHRYVSEAVGAVPLARLDIGKNLWAIDLRLTVGKGKTGFVGNRIDFESELSLTGKVVLRLLVPVVLPFQARASFKGNCVITPNPNAVRFTQQEVLLDLSPTHFDLLELTLAGGTKDGPLGPFLTALARQSLMKLDVTKQARRVVIRPFTQANQGMRSLLEKVVVTKLTTTVEEDGNKEEWITVHGECAAPQANGPGQGGQLLGTKSGSGKGPEEKRKKKGTSVISQG
jgi:serine/threonine protein kinase